VPGRHHARGVVDVEPDVAAVHDARLARVQAHADPQLLVARPGVLGERALRRLRSGNRVAGGRERDGIEPVWDTSSVTRIVPRM